MPGLKQVANRHAAELFDLVAGFAYSQTLLAVIETGALEAIGSRPTTRDELAAKIGLGDEATARLLRAARGIGLVEPIGGDRWMLAQRGAILRANLGVQAMVRHHRLLYADLTDPDALLQADRAAPTALSSFWAYARGEEGSTSEYSALMAASQAMVSQEATAAYDFSRHRAVLDIGGGSGRFAATLARRHPALRLGIFDLPSVASQARAALTEQGRPDSIVVHKGDFFRDSLPSGHDCHTLVRILHDHDDEPALTLLRASRRALPPGGRLVIIEPMTEAGAAPGLSTYFELYLWAMGSGRPRSPKEIHALLREAGFRLVRRFPTSQPLVASVIVGFV